MSACATTTGILFSRKPCGQEGVINCGRCKQPVCKQHIRPQTGRRFLCPKCDAYENDDDWTYSDRDRRWRYRSSSDDDRPAARAAGTAAGTQLGDEDKPGLSTNTSGAWQGPDGEGADADAGDDGDFDAS